MNQAELEAVYEAIAVAVDEAGLENRELYLAKLALALVDVVGDANQCLMLIKACKCSIANT
jgi:hypothetical protein